MADKESHTVEYKQSWRPEHLKVVSAMANGKGGILYIGVDDLGNPVELKNTKKLLEDIPNAVRNKLSVLPSVELGTVQGKEVIKVIISSSSIPVSFNGKYYQRCGSTVQELQGKALSDFLMKHSGKAWDEIVDDKYKYKELDETAITDFTRHAADRIPGIGRETETETLLKKLKLTEEKALKRAAVLLFGSNPQNYFSHAVIKIGRFMTDTDIRTTDIVSGNLFKQVEDTLGVLRFKYLQSTILFEDIRRRDILEYPFEALREAIINAVVHRDYSGFSQIQIRVYPEKLVIMNEGGLPPEVSVDDLKRNHLSKPRNRLLAEIFYFAGYIESWGRGTLKMVEQCRNQGLPDPDFIDHHGTLSVIFYRDKWNEENLEKMGLNERQIKAVMYVKEKGKITNREYRELNKMSDEGARIDINNLIKNKVIIRKGKGRNVQYVLKS